MKGGSARRLKRAGAESKKGWSRVQEGLEQSSRRVGAELEECQCGVVMATLAKRKRNESERKLR